MAKEESPGGWSSCREVSITGSYQREVAGRERGLERLVITIEITGSQWLFKACDYKL
jgi:hypothetical protein